MRKFLMIMAGLNLWWTSFAWSGAVVQAVDCSGLVGPQLAVCQKLAENSGDYKLGYQPDADNTAELMYDIADKFRIVVFALGVPMLVYYAMQILLSSDQAEIVKKDWAKIKWVGIGIVVIYFVPSFVRIASEFGTSGGSVATTTTRLKDTIVLPIKNYLFTFLAAFAVFHIVLSGLRILANNGNPDRIKKNQNNALYTAIGLLVIVLADRLITSIYSYGPGGATMNLTGVWDLGFSLVRYAFGFVALVAVVMVIYAGTLILTAAGNEETTKKGYKILRWVLSGLVLILCAYALVAAIVNLRS